jgi:hypothetical protein
VPYMTVRLNLIYAIYDCKFEFVVRIIVSCCTVGNFSV